MLYYLAWLSEKKLDELLPKVSYLDISSDIATHAFNNLLNKKFKNNVMGKKNWFINIKNF
ncbi:hypothetical protein [Mycoplasmopsis bovis]|uniref:hypothetical protein n=1 Tax=Mycoplasmopsis bovis TaxID=28903 RepID=UPI003D1A00BA